MLGPGSQLVLDEFVYNPAISGGAIVLNLVKGTFRFITGIAAKPAYVIRTPTASIKVRGTIFDVYVQASGLSWLLLIEGAIEVCNERGECRLLDQPGKLLRITPAAALLNPVKWASLPERQGDRFNSAFPFVAAAPLVDPDPIFTPGDIINGNITDTAKPEASKKEEVKRLKRKYKKKVRNVRRKRSSKRRASVKPPSISVTMGIGGGSRRHGGSGRRHKKPRHHRGYNDYRK